MDMEELNRKAAALEPGADGLLVQDHFQGNRTPYTDPLSRGAIVGLTLAHEPHHVFRAIMEGISFGTRAILDAMADAGYRGREITVGVVPVLRRFGSRYMRIQPVCLSACHGRAMRLR